VNCDYDLDSHVLSPYIQYPSHTIVAATLRFTFLLEFLSHSHVFRTWGYQKFSFLWISAISIRVPYTSDAQNALREPEAALRCIHFGPRRYSDIIIRVLRPTVGLLGAFAKFRKPTVSFVMSVYLSIRSSVRMKQLGSHWTDLYEIWYLSISRKSVEKPQVSLKYDKNNWYFTWRPMHMYGNMSLNSC
jgi:hypothetical protein